jgi:hypothetical protein
MKMDPQQLALPKRILSQILSLVVGEARTRESDIPAHRHHIFSGGSDVLATVRNTDQYSEYDNIKFITCFIVDSQPKIFQVQAVNIASRLSELQISCYTTMGVPEIARGVA